MSEQIFVTQRQIKDHKTFPHPFLTLECDCAHYELKHVNSLQWCTHLSEAVSTGYDAVRRDIKSGDIEPILLRGYVQVPITYKPSSVVYVHIAQPEQDQHFAAASLAVVSYGGTSKIELGLVGPGEGRKTLTEMVFDHLAELRENKLECLGKYHTGNKLMMQGMNFDPDQMNNQELAEVINLITTKQCRECNEDNGVPEPDTARGKFTAREAGEDRISTKIARNKRSATSVQKA